MTKRRRWLGPGLGLVVGLLTGAAAVAWACVPQPLVVLKPAASGPAGSQVAVEGIELTGQVEIRWNGSDGPLLGTATGPTVSKTVTIPPDATAGMYSVVVAVRQPGGALGATARASFLVTGGATGPAGSTAVPTSAPKAATRSSSSGSSATAGALAGGGAGLLAGAVGGAVLGRRRRAPSAP